MSHLKVIVRVRPLSQREKDEGCKNIINVENDNTVAITNLKVAEEKSGDSRERVRRFTFDNCLGENATQNDIFSEVEAIVCEAMKKKQHSCVLAYGQSATGKTHTMMGYPYDPGLTPRLSLNITDYFRDVVEDNAVKVKITISYLEVYNEKVRDLLRFECGKDKYSDILRVREHPKKGPYVQGLIEKEVTNSDELLYWVKLGSENRKVASNLRNPHSSRSHSVVTITCDGVRLYLVDLAGSEKTGSKVWANSSIREGANINKSLVALGNVISALAEQSQKQKSSKKRFVPYRDSVLTWLLKDTLGGNSNTVLIATISPASSCYSETVNTLRFGQRAKLIICDPVVIEDPKERIIRELRLEIAKLKKELEESKVCLMSKRRDLSDDTQNSASSLGSFFKDRKTVIQRLEKPNVPDKIEPRKNIDKLISVMNVETIVNPKRRQIPKLRRTSSVNSVAIMNRSRAPSFGSGESLATESARSSLSSSSRKMSSSNPLIRRRSVDKPNLLMKRNSELSRKSSDKSVETEGSAKSRTSQNKTTSINKSNIIANVTKRLYAKTKNTETDMEGFEEPKNEIPKELAICSNARIKLRELTQKAIRAHRYRQAETQTDRIVLRVKEVATDVQDLRQSIREIAEVETMTINDTKDAQVGCSLIDNLDSSDNKNLFKITKTVGIQCKSNCLEVKQNLQTEQSSTPVISFTKFLLDQIVPRQASIVSLCSSNELPDNKLYATTSDGKRSKDMCDQSNCSLSFPTPDLISNHNSLDLNFHQAQTEEPNTPDKKRYAQNNIEHVFYDSLELFENDTLPSEPVKACLVSTDREEKISKRTLYPTINICETFSTCLNMLPLQLGFSRSVMVEVKDTVHNDYIKIREPTILSPQIEVKLNLAASPETPITQVLPEKDPEPQEHPHIEEAPSTSSKNKPNIITAVSESHPESQRRVKKFADKQIQISSLNSTKNKSNIITAMSAFLEEATKLMVNLTKAAENFGDPLAKTEFEVHITSENVEELRNFFDYDNNSSRTIPCYESSSQTPFSRVLSKEAQTESYNIPSNRLDSVLLDAYEKLEFRTTNGAASRRLNSPKDSAFSFSSGVSEVFGDLSLESNSSPSDYGSMSRNKNKKCLPSCSPSELLKQLALMRKHVMKESQKCLQGELYRERDMF